MAACLAVLSGACNADEAAQIAATQAAIDRMEAKLDLLHERLAQMEARANTTPRPAQAEPDEPIPSGLHGAVAVAVDRIEDADKPPARLKLVVTPDEVRLDDAVVSDEALLSAIEHAVARNEVTLQVQADAATPHERLVTLLDLARNAGVTHLAIATGPESEPPPSGLP